MSPHRPATHRRSGLHQTAGVSRTTRDRHTNPRRPAKLFAAVDDDQMLEDNKHGITYGLAVHERQSAMLRSMGIK